MTDSFVHPVISIITPARNQERYIQEMLRSIQAQSFQQWECIVVDDASTDGTADAVHSLHDPRIRLISHEVRQGVSHARNTGMAHAAGTFLYFLDGDDLLFPGSLERFIRCFEAHPRYSVVYGEVQILASDGSPSGKAKAPLFHPRPTGNILTALLKRNLIPTGALCVRAETAQSAGGFNPSLSIAEDWEYWCRLASLTPFFYLGAKPLAGYRIHSAGTSRSGKYGADAGLSAVDAIFSNPSIRQQAGAKKSASLKKEAQASTYEYAANHCLRNRQWQEARQLLRKTLGHSFFRPRAWILLFFACIGFLPGFVERHLK